MTIYAPVSEISTTRLWGLEAGRHLQRQSLEISKVSDGELRNIQWLNDINAAAYAIFGATRGAYARR